MSEKPVSPLVLRDTCAVQYLQAEDKPEALRKRLGLHHLSTITHSQRLSRQLREDQERKVSPTDHCS